jgi:NADH dehydrogenase
MVHTKQKLLVLGGGFGGITAIRNVAHNPNIDITLITDNPTFRYGATVWRAATGYEKAQAYMPIADLLVKFPSVNVIYETAKTIDKTTQQVTTTAGKSYNYDYCVIALGMVTSYFGLQGLEEFSYTIKSSEGLDTLRSHLHQEILDDGVLDKNYVVIGAGPTGVELAAGLRTYLKKVAKRHGLKRSKVNVELIEAAPRVLPSMDPRVSRLVNRRLRKLGVVTLPRHHVQSESKASLVVDKRRIPTQTVVWTAGVSNSPFFAANSSQFLLNERGKVLVNGYLQAADNVFVIGDNAATPYSGLALTAVHNAKYVAHCLDRLSRGKSLPRPYKPSYPLTIIPVGDGWAVMQWKKIVLSGRLVSLFRLLLDLVGYQYVMDWRRALRIWRHLDVPEERCPTCQSALKQAA